MTNERRNRRAVVASFIVHELSAKHSRRSLSASKHDTFLAICASGILPARCDVIDQLRNINHAHFFGRPNPDSKNLIVNNHIVINFLPIIMNLLESCPQPSKRVKVSRIFIT